MAPRQPHQRPLARVALLAAAVAVTAASVVAVAAVLAIRNGQDPQPQVQDRPALTPPPTVTPTPSPTPAATPSPTPDAPVTCQQGWTPQHHRALGVALCHPDTWQAQATPDGLKLLNPQAAQARHPEPGTGTAVVDVVRLPASAAPTCAAPEQATVGGRAARRCVLAGEAAARAGVARSVTYVVPAGGDAAYVFAAYLQDPGAAENAAVFDRLVASAVFP